MIVSNVILSKLYVSKNNTWIVNAFSQNDWSSNSFFYKEILFSRKYIYFMSGGRGDAPLNLFFFFLLFFVSLKLDASSPIFNFKFSIYVLMGDLHVWCWSFLRWIFTPPPPRKYFDTVLRASSVSQNEHLASTYMLITFICQ